MRYTGVSIQRTIRLALVEHRRAPSIKTAMQLAKLRALRALYETSVHARITLPGVGEAQRPLREATECYRVLRKLHDIETWELRRLRKTIEDVRQVPMELPDIDFTV